MSSFPGEVDIAFKAVKKLVDEGLAIYDDELKNRRNFKDQKLKFLVKTESKIQRLKPSRCFAKKVHSMII